MPEFVVIINSMGGAVVLTCQQLGFNNIEMPYEVTADNIKKTILDYKYLKEEDADFDIMIEDHRPPEENFNEKRLRESKSLNKNHNIL
jgi:hypothetical protein